MLLAAVVVSAGRADASRPGTDERWNCAPSGRLAGDGVRRRSRHAAVRISARRPSRTWPAFRRGARLPVPTGGLRVPARRRSPRELGGRRSSRLPGRTGPARGAGRVRCSASAGPAPCGRLRDLAERSRTLGMQHPRLRSGRCSGAARTLFEDPDGAIFDMSLARDASTLFFAHRGARRTAGSSGKSASTAGD